MYIIVAKKFKSVYSYYPNYILNDILSNLWLIERLNIKMLPWSKMIFVLQL
jgi:hypothetical protein